MSSGNTKELDFEPTQKEIDVYNQEKMNIYKGTFIVCLVYGLTALGLLLFGLFTELGNEYVFNKLLPATATFVFGALFIIIYLSITIYDLKPQKIRNKIEKDQSVICPDYWTLQKISDDFEKRAYFANVRTNNGTILIPEIKSQNSPLLKYKCVYENNMSNKNDLLNTNKGTKVFYKGYNHGTTLSNDNNHYVVAQKDDNGIIGYQSNNVLKNYAQFSGLYANSLSPMIVTKKEDNSSVSVSEPLVCNIVLPQVLENYDKDTVEKNKYRCDYAKACNISWTDIGCK